MKKLYALLFFVAASFTFSNSFANTVYVSGYVKNNGVAMANKAVKIWVDSLNINQGNTCFAYQVRTKYTNANGFYSDTFTCINGSGNITVMRTSTEGCNGTILDSTTIVNANGAAISNFSLNCVQATCSSNFIASAFTTSGTPYVFFNGQSSTAVTGDQIIKYKWSYGDGAADSSATLNWAQHTYPAFGNYQACLTISTAGGCIKTTCKNITIIDSSNLNCHANYSFAGNTIVGGTLQFTNSSTFATGATAASFRWNFNDGTPYATVANPSHIYTTAGTYSVCLKIRSTTGCVDSICKTVTITNPALNCNAGFQFVKDSLNYKSVTFYTGNTTNVAGPETAIQRIWTFGDGDSAVNNTTSNGQIITHVYANPGTYTVCQKIKTVSGCTAQSCQTVVVIAPAPPPFVCTAVAAFTYVPVAALVKFNSSISTPGINDTIISRKWVFGDSSVLTGNVIDPQHQYAQAGIYNACLTIKTSKGCERTFCAIVTATNVNSNCVPQFSFQKIAPKKVSFNSTMSWVPAGDSIVERKWTFGDGTSLTGAFGSVANVTHEYSHFGIYTACLRIKTASGCTNEICKPVVLADSIVQPPLGDPIHILNLYPNPVHAQLTTVVWSSANNVVAELAIYDIYGMKKWSTNKTLLQGNNITVIPTLTLANGPYFFKVTTTYGVKSRAFYKL